MLSNQKITEPIKLERSHILGSIATLFSGSIIAQAMTALALLLTARQLNAEGYGQYAACVALTSIASIVFSLGLDIWLLREGGKDSTLLPKLTGSILGIKIILGVLWMVVIAFFSQSLNQSTYPNILMRWSAILIWLDTLLATTLTGFKSALINKIPALLEAGADLLWFGGTILLVLFGMKHPEIFLQIRVVVSSAALLLAIFLFHRKVGIQFDPVIANQALKSVFPFATSEFLGMVTLRADVVIVGLTLGKYATGIYSPAVGLINMAMLTPMAVYMVMVPVLGNLYKNHPQQARITSRRTIVLLIITGIVLMLLFIAAAPLVVLLLGESYQPSVMIIRILSLVLFFKCISFAMAAIIIATDKQARRTVVQTIAAVTNIILNLAIVQSLGVRGVAGVYVFTEIILMVGYTLVVWKKR